VKTGKISTREKEKRTGEKAPPPRDKGENVLETGGKRTSSWAGANDLSGEGYLDGYQPRGLRPTTKGWASNVGAR